MRSGQVEKEELLVPRGPTTAAAYALATSDGQMGVLDRRRLHAARMLTGAS